MDKATFEKPQTGINLDHYKESPVVVTFRTRYHAMVAWNSIKQVLDNFQVPMAESAFLMETMSSLAEACDKSIKEELEQDSRKIIIEE